MKKLILAASALTLMSGAALADEVDGIVAKFNPAVRIITLTDGRSYTIPRSVAIPPSLGIGSKVTISEEDNGTKIDAVMVGSMM